MLCAVSTFFGCTATVFSLWVELETQMAFLHQRCIMILVQVYYQILRNLLQGPFERHLFVLHAKILFDNMKLFTEFGFEVQMYVCILQVTWFPVQCTICSVWFQQVPVSVQDVLSACSPSPGLQTLFTHSITTYAVHRWSHWRTPTLSHPE